MKPPNNMQVGGVHYQALEYQHWDMVIDCGMHYIPAVAIKYISRWRVKGGEEDLLKAKHCTEKALDNERQIDNIHGITSTSPVVKFIKQFKHESDKLAMAALANMRYEIALTIIDSLLAEATLNNGGYVNQDDSQTWE